MASGKRRSFALPPARGWRTVPRVNWSFKLTRIAGIDVRVHFTFFLLLAWFGYIYYAQDGLGAMVVGLAFILLLFVCVVLHEFGHALAARGYGINTPDITLLPIGGVARLERMPDNPWQELVVALAGPAVNVVIAIALFIVLGRMVDVQDVENLAGGRGNLLVKLLVINVVLVIFNMLPAFPMDGGRVLRALLATRLKHAKATRIAAGVGQVVAVLFGLLGVYAGNPFLILIAVFVFFGARAEATFANFKEAVEDTRVSSIMRPMGPVLHPGMSVAEAVQAAMAGHSGVLPVVDSSLRLLALVPAASLASALRWDPQAGIESLARHDFEVLTAEASLSEALVTARTSTQATFPVVNTAGQLVGLLGRDDIENALRGAR